MGLGNKLTGIKEMWQFHNRWHLIMSRLFFPHEKINIYRYNGLEILADHSAGDANGLREIFSRPTYRQYVSLIDLTHQPLNILDIGSNIGGFSLLLKAEKANFKKLACVEMNPNTFSRLRYNIARNFDCPVTLINGAVCETNDPIYVSLGEGNQGDSLLVRREDNRMVKLQGYTFDQVYRDAFDGQIVDLCKIDIEGAEVAVFTNPGHELITNCRWVVMELHGPGRREPVQQEMRRLDFTELDADGKDDAMDYIHLFRNDRF